MSWGGMPSKARLESFGIWIMKKSKIIEIIYRTKQGKKYGKNMPNFGGSKPKTQSPRAISLDPLVLEIIQT